VEGEGSNKRGTEPEFAQKRKGGYPQGKKSAKTRKKKVQEEVKPFSNIGLGKRKDAERRPNDIGLDSLGRKEPVSWLLPEIPSVENLIPKREARKKI